ncbi:glycosyltransferase family 4 protein [Acidomonas methanolica]|uniref:glycosyltransferase family 4 protein n=1 Tax=Acidomonas methanolica TaxID=437 RepID=UPI00211A5743|nr:glycosyltransferase family 1 protein [Acidomonas methanolica]MCQ9155614.1 glycosyltransferase family 4 protein [Acidomonas methanolica]
MTETRKQLSILFDISRLISRAAEPVPTGIDRVELVYAEYLLARYADRLTFGAMHPILGTYGALPFDQAKDFVLELQAVWNGRPDGPKAGRLGAALRRQTLRRLRPKIAGEVVHLHVSHHHLTRPRVIRNVVRGYRARFVPMVHDFIPLDYPEYARPGEPARHETRIRTVTRYAGGVIVPSQEVQEAMQHRLAAAGRAHVPVWIVPHGVHKHPPSDLPPHRSDRPYFVCLGTIEPRKNHLLLLNLWRRLVMELGPKAPKLVIIGKRGWENENILDMLDRCEVLRGHVEEHNGLSDGEVVRYLLGSRALLFPSFVEGFGLPLAEALSLGVPSICSDIPVLREVGGDAAIYVDPLDGVGFRAAIDKALRHELLPDATMRALRAWKPLSWTESVGMAMAQIEAG